MVAESLAAVPVALATADDGSAALAAALDEAGDARWSTRSRARIVVAATRAAASDPSSTPRLVASLLAERAPGGRVDVLAPPSLLKGLLPPGAGWTEVVVAPPAERIERVVVPRVLTTGPFLLAIDLAANRSRPIDVLARHAHPRHLAAARLAPASLALAAELALAFGPRTILLLGTIAHRPLALATPDLIAAELVRIALRPSPADAPGPWEDPVVQRATELDLGVRLPAQIALRPRSLAGDPEAAHVLDRLCRRLQDRLGIPVAPPPGRRT